MVCLGLGTVQLGLPYGNAAQAPIMPLAEAHSILTLAVRHGIRFFDTAAAYGESESRLGLFDLSKKSDDVIVSSKIPIVDSDVWKSERLYRQFVFDTAKKSLDLLRIKKMRLLQFHQSTLDFMSCPHIALIMRELIDAGICDEIGISIYAEDEFEMALNIPLVTWLQIPINIIDTRFVKMAASRQNRRIKLIARSVLLQGVLVENAPLPTVARAAALAEMKEFAVSVSNKIGMPLEQLAFRYVFQNLKEFLDIALIGVDSRTSLEQNLEIIERCVQPLSTQELALFEPVRQYARDQGLLNPGHWNSNN